MEFKNTTNVEKKKSSVYTFHVSSKDLSMRVEAKNSDEAVIKALMQTTVIELNSTIVCRNLDNLERKPDVFITTEVLYSIGFENVSNYK